ncbi:MAG: hypothetical protein IJY85_00730 [Ruminococcus sp.]|nr:hypothetical protein [Ruminococcus sp.]
MQERNTGLKANCLFIHFSVGNGGIIISFQIADLPHRLAGQVILPDGTCAVICRKREVNCEK